MRRERDSIMKKYKMPECNIFLIGFMGAGKSTIARTLNREYGMKVVEMDQIIVERNGMEISDIFAEKGEEFFRSEETRLLEDICGMKNVVVSCGGGAAMRAANVEIMKKGGVIVLLSATPETVLGRVRHRTNRPLLEGKKNVEDISKLMEERRERYEAAADVVVPTDDRTVNEIVADIAQRVSAFKGGR